MNNPVKYVTPLDLTVRFLGGPPIDEIVYWVRRCAEQALAGGELTVVIDASASKPHKRPRTYTVRIERPDRLLSEVRDANLMLAVRHAFERLPFMPGGIPPHAAERRSPAAR